MPTDRQKTILYYIVEDYIKTAQPVGSSYLVSSFELNCSDATVRNECQVLEKEGFLTHPHTSAGRIPTEQGYREYLESHINSKKSNNNIIKKDSLTLEKIYNQLNKATQRDKAKSLAKSLAELSQAAVLIGFDKRDIYYTGLSYLFAQPEFQDHSLVYNIGEVVDHLDEMVPTVYDEMDDDICVKIGSDNAFSNDCSFIGTKFGRDGKQLVGLLGPMRMSYIDNIGRLQRVKQLLSS